jgi:hypothetical protein
MSDASIWKVPVLNVIVFCPFTTGQRRRKKEEKTKTWLKMQDFTFIKIRNEMNGLYFEYGLKLFFKKLFFNYGEKNSIIFRPDQK